MGTAGWSIPRASQSRFTAIGTHLQRYAGGLDCVEINSSFYRPHAAATYAKWRDNTPPAFRFAVKMPKRITHELKLQDAHEPLAAFLAQSAGLAEKRGPILVQLPPSLSFDAAVVIPFLELLRRAYGGPLVCEPRHATWFSPKVTALLADYRIARVAADPSRAPTADVPAGWPGMAYFRLHGSPRTYWSRYDASYLDNLAATVRGLTTAEEVWCVFDNTASGAAIENACELRDRVTIDSPVRQLVGSPPPAGATPSGIDRGTLVTGAPSAPIDGEAMPFKSQAQRRKFAHLLVEGKISDDTFEEWNRETGRKKLPERVKAKRASSKKAQQRSRRRAAKRK